MEDATMKKEYIKPMSSSYLVDIDAVLQVNNSVTDQEQLTKGAGSGSEGGGSMWEYMDEDEE